MKHLEQFARRQGFVIGDGCHVLLTEGRTGRSLDFGQLGKVIVVLDLP